MDLQRTAAAAAVLVLTGCELFGGSTPSFCGHDTAPFLESTEVALPLEYEQAFLATGDLDGDGVQDLLLTAPSGQIFIWSLKDGAPTVLQRPATIDAPTTHHFTGGVLLDLDGDGHDEVLLLSSTTDRLLVVDGQTLAVRQQLATPANPAFPVLADLDGDGLEELVVAGVDDHQVAVYARSGGGLVAGPRQTFPGPIDGLEVEDLDGDGLPELILSSFDPGPGHGVARVYSPFLTLDADRTPRWSGFYPSPSATFDASGLRFALMGASFERHPAQQLLAVDQGAFRLWGAEAGPQLPAGGLGFDADGVTALDVDGDLRQDVFAWFSGGVLGEDGGSALLGAVAYGEPGALSAPRPITVGFSPRRVTPVLRHQPWTLELAAVGVNRDGGLGLHFLADLCARHGDLQVVSAGPAVQVVQSLDGSVPLFSGKPTAVPVTVASLHPLRHAGLRAQLVDAQGTVLAELPVGRPRPPPRLKPGLEGRATFQVVVPPELVTAGTLRVRAQVLPPTAAADGDASDDARTTSFEVQASRAITFAVVSWRYQVCAEADAQPGNALACRQGAALSTLAPAPQASLDATVGALRQALPSGAVSFQTLELVDPDLAQVVNGYDLSRMISAGASARLRFDQQHPGLASAPIFLVTGGPGSALGIPSLTAFGNPATAVHEVGHMAGAHHVQCGSATVAGPDLSYPYAGGRIGGPDGGTETFFGVDVRPASSGWWAQYVGPRTCDLMSYGGATWPSDWTYHYLQQGVGRW